MAAKHYEPVGAALLWTLEQGLGPSFTPPVKAAWTETYMTLAGVMQKAAATVGPLRRARSLRPVSGRDAARSRARFTPP